MTSRDIMISTVETTEVMEEKVIPSRASCTWSHLNQDDKDGVLHLEMGGMLQVQKPV